MKPNKISRFLLTLAMIAGCFGLRAQSVQLHVNTHPSPYFSDWQQHRETAFMILTNTGSAPVKFRIGTQLYNGAGTMIAETDITKMPEMQINPGAPTQYFFEDIYPLDAIKYHGNYDVNPIIRCGKMPDDNYRLCVQLVDPATGAQLGIPQCQSFSIIAYQQPTLFAPRNAEEVVRDEVRRPTFRWTPVQPHYPGIITYRLTIMEILPGQEAGQAFRTNHPILEKDYKNTTQAIWPLDFQMPDAGQKYVWSVQALDDQDRPIGENEGRAEYSTISVVNKGQGLGRAVTLLLPKNGSEAGVKIPPTFRWTPVQPGVAFGEVNYKLQIFETDNGVLPADTKKWRPGQHGKPILEKTVKNQTSTSLPYGTNLDTGKTYMWCVQVVDENRGPIGENEGRSEYASFWIGRCRTCDLNIVQLATPADNSSVSISELQQPGAISWECPLCPPMATYKASIIEVGKGKTPAQAKAKRPIGRPIMSWPTKGIMSTSLPGDTNLDTGKTYLLSVQAFDEQDRPIGENEGRSGYVAFTNIPLVLHYKPRLSLTAPADNGSVTDALPTFKWTPVQPSRPGGSVTYILTVVKLQNGELPSVACCRNPHKPIMEKPYLNITSATWPEDASLPDSGATYAWGVQALDENGKGIGENEGRSGDVYSFRINKPMVEHRSVTLTAPANNGNVTDDLPTFKWTPVQPSRPGGTVTYKLTVVKLEDGQVPSIACCRNPHKPILSKPSINVTSTSWPSDAPLPDSGATYAWGVQALDDNGKGIGDNEGRSGDVYSFAFRPNRPMISKPGISLISPENNGSVSTDAPAFKWTPVQPSRPNVTYRLSITEVGEGQTPEQAFRRKPMMSHDYKNITSGTLSDGNDLEVGKTYAWCVQALDEQDKPIGENEGRSGYAAFHVNKPMLSKPGITLAAPANGGTLEPGAAFRWTPVQPSRPGVTYRLSITEVGEGQTPDQAYRTNKPIMEKDYKNVSADPWKETGPPKKEGVTYVWCVQALDENGKPIGENEGRAEYRTFRRGDGAKGRPGVRLKSPVDNATVSATDLSKLSAFSWGYVPCSGCPPPKIGKMMVVEVQPGQTTEQAFRVNRPILEKDYKNITSTGWPSDVKLPDTGKTYSWCVQALDDNGKGIGDNEGRSGYASFHINRPMLPKPYLSLSSPANNALVSVGDLKKTGAFKWTPVQPSGKSVVTYKLSITEVSNGQSPDQALHINKPILERDYKSRSSVALPNDVKLDTGKTYVWSVTAEGCKGCSGEGSGGGGFATFRTKSNMGPNGMPPTVSVACEIGGAACQWDGICKIRISITEPHTLTLSPDKKTLILLLDASKLEHDQPDKMHYYKGQSTVNYTGTWTAPDDVNKALQVKKPIVVKPGLFKIRWIEGKTIEIRFPL